MLRLLKEHKAKKARKAPRKVPVLCDLATFKTELAKFEEQQRIQMQQEQEAQQRAQQDNPGFAGAQEHSMAH